MDTTHMPAATHGHTNGGAHGGHDGTGAADAYAPGHHLLTLDALVRDITSHAAWHQLRTFVPDGITDPRALATAAHDAAANADTSDGDREWANAQVDAAIAAGDPAAIAWPQPIAREDDQLQRRADSPVDLALALVATSRGIAALEEALTAAAQRDTLDDSAQQLLTTCITRAYDLALRNRTPASRAGHRILDRVWSFVALAANLEVASHLDANRETAEQLHHTRSNLHGVDLGAGDAEGRAPLDAAADHIDHVAVSRSGHVAAITSLPGRDVTLSRTGLTVRLDIDGAPATTLAGTPALEHARDTADALDEIVSQYQPGITIDPVVVVTGATGLLRPLTHVTVCSPDQLAEVLGELARVGAGSDRVWASGMTHDLAAIIRG